MPYFSLLPNVEYSISPTDRKVARNILVRAKITDGIRSLMSTSAEYTIAEGEKPEHIAHRVYGRPDYHWIILLFNEIHDPYFSWPLSGTEFDSHMSKTYPGKALYIHTGGIIESGKQAIINRTKGIPHDRRLPHFEVGSTLEQYDIINPNVKTASATIKEWNPDLCKIVIDDIEGVFRLQGMAAKVDASIGQLAYISDPLSLPRDIVCKNSQGDEIAASLVRITESNLYAIHHFVDELGGIASPWHVPQGRAEASTAPLIERFATGRQESIEVLDQLPDGREATRTYSAVTNFGYEEETNQAKRKIRVMDPVYIDTLLRELGALFGS